MSVRAVLLDLYKTLLTVGPPPRAADAHWQALARRVPGPAPSRAAFDAACLRAVRLAHRHARAAGIAWPEVDWNAIACTAWPALASLRPAARAHLLAGHAQLARTVRLPASAAAFLRAARDRRIPLGLVSNAQPYTLAELRRELARHGLSLRLFAPDLRFLSFENGFAKPDPHVFRLLATRLARRGIPAANTLVVGDRLDNDIGPALRAGFRAWHYRGPADWPRLRTRLERTEEEP